MNSILSLHRPSGLRGLFIIWLGQMISGTAASITFYALPAWILSRTQSSGNALGTWEALYFGFYLFMLLFAGVLIDRYNRKSMMLVYDLLSLGVVVTLLFFEQANVLELWHIYVAAAIQGIGFAFQAPSYSAAITTMMSKRNYVRANGFISLLDHIPDIFGPLLAVVFIQNIGLSGILSINLITYLISISAILFVVVPQPAHTEAGDATKGQLLKEVFFGIRYIVQRPGLLGLQLIFLFGNFFSGIALSVTSLYTMVALRTGGDPTAAGTAQSVAAIAAVVAGAILTLVGGIRRPVRVILLGWIISSIFGLTLFGIANMVVFWVIAAVVDAFFEPVVNVSIDTFLQTKVPPEMQGRVFSASDFLAQAMIPITPLVAAVLGGGIFEPAMQEGGQLVQYFGWIVGTGPGSGYGLMIFMCGIAGALIGLSGYLVSAIRNVDITLPDTDTLPYIENPVGVQKKEEK